MIFPTFSFEKLIPHPPLRPPCRSTRCWRLLYVDCKLQERKRERPCSTHDCESKNNLIVCKFCIKHERKKTCFFATKSKCFFLLLCSAVILRIFSVLRKIKIDSKEDEVRRELRQLQLSSGLVSDAQRGPRRPGGVRIAVVGHEQPVRFPQRLRLHLLGL